MTLKKTCRRDVIVGAVGGAAGVAASKLGLAAGNAPRRFVELEEAVKIPLRSLQNLWEPVSFRARFTKQDGKPAVAPGIAVRVPDAGIQTFCLYCPHELCLMTLSAAKRLFCGCHSSTFDPLQRGAWISGPAPRETYRYKVALASNDLIITAVEAELVDRL